MGYEYSQMAMLRVSKTHRIRYKSVKRSSAKKHSIKYAMSVKAVNFSTICTKDFKLKVYQQACSWTARLS